MNKKIDTENDPIAEALEKASNNGKLAKFANERVLRAALTISRLIQHYEPDQIPESIPITEYAKYDPKYCKELKDTDELSEQTQYDIYTDLLGLGRTSFELVGISKKTGKRIGAYIWPFDFAIEESDQITIRCLSKQQSYKKYLNDHNDVEMVLPEPKSQKENEK